MPYIKKNYPIIHIKGMNNDNLYTTFKPVVNNPNSWNLDNFIAGTKQEDGTILSYDSTDPDKYIVAATNVYSSQIATIYKSLKGTLAGTDVGYIGLTSAKNWIEIGGLSGTLTNIAINYWGDHAAGGNSGYIAKTIKLQADDTDDFTTLTRGGRGSYNYTPTVELPIWNKLRIYFSNSTGGSEALCLVYSIKFTMI